MSKRDTLSFDDVTGGDIWSALNVLEVCQGELKVHESPQIRATNHPHLTMNSTAQLRVIEVLNKLGKRPKELTAHFLTQLPESSQGVNCATQIKAQPVQQITWINTIAEQLNLGGKNYFNSRGTVFHFIFSPMASPTPSLRKDSVSAKRSRNGRGMSAPCPAWLSASMSSPRPWAGNGQAMSVGSPQTVHVRVQSASASSPCPRQCPPHVRKSPCIVRRLAFSESENVRTGYALSPQRRLICDRWLATQSPDGVLGMSALWPAGVRAKST